MPNKSKIKGTTFERELVSEAKTHGLKAQRAWGSNGKSLGLEESVDLIIENIKIQAKRRKKLAGYLQIPDSCDAVIFRQDRGKTYVFIEWEDFIELIIRNLN